jgi:hypothetical protein
MEDTAQHGHRARQSGSKFEKKKANAKRKDVKRKSEDGAGGGEGGAGGTLTLRASRHEDQLILRMTSPGSLTATTAHGREESFGIGWANVQERLSLVFGPAARLRPAEADGLVTVEIRIPQPRPSPT